MRFCEYNNCRQPVFGSDKKTRKGYCKSHQWVRTDIDKRSIIHKAMGKEKLKRIASKLKALPENIEMVNRKKELDEWFAYHMVNSLRECENCKSNLTSYNDSDWKACQHHLIDKSKVNGCPSVATVLENHGVLCKWGKGDAGGCHSLWHSSYEVAAKMPFFKIAKERFDKFKHLIAPEERRKIPEIFLK